MKYKIGDKVRIRKDLVPGNEYGGICYVELMDKFKDKECIITYVDNTSYHINDSKLWWTDEMLQDVENNIMEVNNMDRLGIYQHIINNLEDTYKKKNSDYGNSVGNTYEKFGDISFLTRITDKYNRMVNLVCNSNNVRKVKDEALEDTILDLANYCLLWLVERDYKEQEVTKLGSKNKPFRDIECELKNPVSNYNEVQTEVTNNVQDRLSKMDDDDFKTVLNMLEAYGVPYELRPNGREDNKVKLVLVVPDMTLLQRIINNLGI